MTDKDIIERWLKGRLADLCEESQCEVPELPKEVIEGKMLALREILSFIDTLKVKEVKEEPVSEDLEKAAEEYAYTNWESDDYHEGAAEGLPFDAIGHTEKCFKAGAEWQKSRMTKDAIDIEYDNLVAYDIIYKICQVLGEGGKGKMVIIKQEEE